MDITQQTCRTFVDELASGAPAPGGGGAAAFAAALGTALGAMVCSLTVGKKKYAPVEAEMQALADRCLQLRRELMDQVEADEIGFLPLAQVYALPKTDSQRAALLEAASLRACEVPMHIMELCCEAICCLASIAEHGNRLAVSDAGSGAVLCGAALQAASLNIFANTMSMKNREAAGELNRRATAMMRQYGPMADRIFTTVLEALS